MVVCNKTQAIVGKNNTLLVSKTAFVIDICLKPFPSLRYWQVTIIIIILSPCEHLPLCNSL